MVLSASRSTVVVKSMGFSVFFRLFLRDMYQPPALPAVRHFVIGFCSTFIVNELYRPATQQGEFEEIAYLVLYAVHLNSPYAPELW